jgi:hypothetical protein
MSSRSIVFTVLVACTPQVMSNDVHTSAIYAEWTIEQRGQSGVTANATFHIRSADGADVVLTSPDHADCNGIALDGVAKNVPLEASYAFELVRGAEAQSATLPPPLPFTITSAPLDGTYDDQYTLTWSGDALGQARVDIRTLSAQPSCVSGPIVTNAPDTGTFAFDGSAFGASRAEAPPSCTYTIEITRKRSVLAPAGFAGGEITSRYVQTILASVHP